MDTVAVSTFNITKDAGHEGFSAEFVKTDTPKLFTMLRILFEKCVNNEQIPLERKVS